MLYNQNNLNVARMCAKPNDPHEELTGVYFTPDRTVGTDSFRLLEVSTPKNVDAADFPNTDAMTSVQPFIVNAKALKDIKIPKKMTLPVLENVAIKSAGDHQVEFITTDLVNTGIVSASRIDGKFPDYAPLFPTEEPTVELVINGRMLAELLEVMAKLPGNEAVKMSIYGKDKPVVLESRTAGDVQRARGMMMPIRS